MIQKNDESNVEPLKPLDAPYFSVGSVTIQGTGNGFVLTLSRPFPILKADGQHDQDRVLNQPVAIISISPQTAKDMLLLLSDSVAKHEKMYGEINTPYTKKHEPKAG